MPGAVFRGRSQEEYGAEVQRLVQFLDTGGRSLRETLEKEREQASEDLDFERASAFHKRVEKLDEALRGGPELARRVTDINAVILQRGAEDQTIGAYAVRRLSGRAAGGALCGNRQRAKIRRTAFPRLSGSGRFRR